MSVTQPADSGGGNTSLEQNLQVDEKMAEGNTMCSWAQMMEEEEEYEIASDTDDNKGTDEIDGGEASTSPDRKRRIPDNPPFKAQITNISSGHSEEELLYYFGGEEMVKNVSFRIESGKAEMEFITKDGLLFALEKHDHDFRGRQLKVFVIQHRESVGRVTSRYNEDRQYGSHDSRPYNNRRESYRQNHYNSQTSLNSERNSRYNNDKGYNQSYNHNNTYGTMPAGGFHDRKGYNRDNRDANRSYQGYNNGGNNRNNYRQKDNFNYDRQYSNPQYGNRNDNGGPLQRSGSYQSGRYDNRQGGNISARSRTESHSTNFDSISRASSKMSVLDDHPKPVVKKPSVNPFGDAKPVDTETKLRELEDRLKEKEKQQKELRESQQALHEPVIEENEEKRSFTKHQNKHSNSGKHYQKNDNCGTEHRYDSTTNEHNKYQHRRNSFEHGAPPGSVLIKKREHKEEDVERQRDEECSTPPVDPIQYPTNMDVSKKESSASEKSFVHPLPPQYPNNNQRQKTVRPSQKPFIPRAQLQKSATMGQIERIPKQNENDDSKTTRRESVGGGGEGKRNNRGGGHRNEGNRRPSFSGSESGGGTQRNDMKMTRGMNRRGGSGTRGGGGNGRGGQKRNEQTEYQNKAISEGNIEENEMNEETKIEKKEEIIYVEEERNDEIHSQEERSEEIETKSDNMVIQQSTPKKKDKKKDKKKEAKTHNLSGNKYALLADCPQ